MHNVDFNQKSGVIQRHASPSEASQEEETPALSLRLRIAAIHEAFALLRISCVFVARLLRDLLRVCCASVYSDLDSREGIHG
jgi:hypothetical protein